MRKRAIFFALLLAFGACERHAVTELSLLEKEGHESGNASTQTPDAAEATPSPEAPKFFPTSK